MFFVQGVLVLWSRVPKAVSFFGFAGSQLAQFLINWYRVLLSFRLVICIICVMRVCADLPFDSETGKNTNPYVKTTSLLHICKPSAPVRRN
ncbi:hypothetical protein C8R42DRAFT_111996 [Lentinula raphanica]|nr:hypothetical protein C8R42DRAFT_111996 [Lentinula raphanica]